jgi:hypothetical protein
MCAFLLIMICQDESSAAFMLVHRDRMLHRPCSLTLSRLSVGVPQVTVAPMDVTGDRPRAGRFLGPSKAVIRGATGSQNHGSSLSPES